jgi:hypothetical protein
MLRAGMIRQEAAGIYAWLPLGLKVLKKIEQVVREEMDRAGAIEVLMPTLQLADLWRESGRYDDYGDEMLRIKDRHDRDLLYGPTAEEVITDIFRAYIKSYKDLPKNLYNIQWKFRDERRPRFGVMRGREFLMKDAYSFDIDEGWRKPISRGVHSHGRRCRNGRSGQRSHRRQLSTSSSSAGSRSATSSASGPNIRRSSASPMQHADRPHAQSSTWAATASASRGWSVRSSRRATTTSRNHLARRGRAVRAR